MVPEVLMRPLPVAVPGHLGQALRAALHQSIEFLGRHPSNQVAHSGYCSAPLV